MDSASPTLIVRVAVSHSSGPHVVYDELGTHECSVIHASWRSPRKRGRQVIRRSKITKSDVRMVQTSKQLTDNRPSVASQHLPKTSYSHHTKKNYLTWPRVESRNIGSLITPETAHCPRDSRAGGNWYSVRRAHWLPCRRTWSLV